MNKIDYIHKDTRTLPDTITGEIQTITRWQDPTIEEYKKEIERLKNGYCELEKYFAKPNKFIERPERMKILDKLKELKGESN